MTEKRFEELFSELSFSDRFTMYNEYCYEYCNGDNVIYYFDNDFFSMAFLSPMEAARATFFGNIQSWNDEFIKFNAYGNLESLSEYDVESEIDGYILDIFEHEEIWGEYIEDEDDEEEECE